MWQRNCASLPKAPPHSPLDGVALQPPFVSRYFLAWRCQVIIKVVALLCFTCRDKLDLNDSASPFVSNTSNVLDLESLEHPV
jgi:hypothetical protein